MSTITTDFRHRLGPVVISTGIGKTLYGAYAVKPNGSLKRLTGFRESRNPEIVLKSLQETQSTTIREHPA
jgi:hypothetical protein